jgi:hypothetical protein
VSFEVSEDFLKESVTVDGRAEIAHAMGEDVVEGRETVQTAHFCCETRTLSLSDPISTFSREPLPKGVFIRVKVQEHRDLFKRPRQI